MRILLLVIALAAFAWGGYWYVGSTALEQSLAKWFEDRRDDGWQASYAKLNTSGFPNRFDTTITGLALADPDAGISWSAPFFQILALSYRPHHVIAVWPNGHSFATPYQTIEIVTDSARGSVVLKPEAALTLDRSQFVVENLRLASNAGWALSAREFRFATRPTAGRDMSYDIGLSAVGVSPKGWFDDLTRANDLPDEFRDLSIDAAVLFDAPWDRFAIETARPQPREIDLRNLSAAWGEMEFQMTGKLEVDDVGIPTGSIAIRARNWRDMLDLAVVAGAISEQTLPAFESGLEMLAGISGNPEHIDATLNFRGGFVGIGPIPLAPAPRIFLR